MAYIMHVHIASREWLDVNGYIGPGILGKPEYKAWHLKDGLDAQPTGEGLTIA